MTGLVSFSMWNLYKNSGKIAHNNFAGWKATALHIHTHGTPSMAVPILYVCHWAEEAQWYKLISAVCVVSHLIKACVCSRLPLIGTLCAPQITGFQPSGYTAQLAVSWSCIVWAAYRKCGWGVGGEGGLCTPQCSPDCEYLSALSIVLSS